MDSLLLGAEEEPSLPDKVLQNFLIKVSKLMYFLLLSVVMVGGFFFLQPEDAKPTESKPLGRSVLPEPGNTSYLLELKVYTEVSGAHVVSEQDPRTRRRVYVQGSGSETRAHDDPFCRVLLEDQD